MTKDRYKAAAELYGVKCSLWSMIHENFSPSMFCEENRKSIISEYLFWEELVQEMKKENVPYYQGIDIFLQEYKNAVYNCLNITLEA